MKNKIILLISIYFLSCLNLFSSENFFDFESKYIEYSDNQNLITAKEDVKITTVDGIIATADESRFYKTTNKLFLYGNVKIFDETNDVTLESNEIEYDKNKELIISKNETIIYFNNGYTINTSDLNYLRIDEILKSDKNTILIDSLKNKIEAINFNYYNKNKIFNSKKINFNDIDSNTYNSKNVIIDLNNNQLAAKDIEIYFTSDGGLGKNSRLKGNSIISDKSTSIIKKGIFTSCEPTDDCPPWSLEANEVIHDKKNKTINYNKAWLRIYDKPIFYFPKFFHPDPTVKRQSGFLMPSMISSSNSGNSLKIPYYHVFSDDKDLTIKPRLYLNNDILIENEYRQVGKNHKHISDFSFNKHDNGSKSHIFSNTIINSVSEKFDYSNIEINFENTSNDTYLKHQNLKESITQSNQDLLNTFVKFEAGNDDLDLMVEASAFKDLTKEKDSDKYQYILPNFKISKFISTNSNFNGDLIFSSYGASQKNDTNVTENYIINDFDYNSENFIFKKGLVSNLNLSFKNTTKDAKNSNRYEDELKSDNFILLNYNIKFPLKKESKFLMSNLTPKINLKYSPFKNENIQGLDRNIYASNIFSDNRLGLIDSLEGGQSLTLGFDYDISKKDNSTIFKSSLAQIFRDINDDSLPKKAKMQTKRSDIVGEISFSPNESVNFNYNFSADNDLKSVDYNLIKTDITINNFVTSFEFLEENNEIGQNSYFARKIKYGFDNNNSILFNTRRNRKTDLTEFYNLIYEYKNDCLSASVEYNKNYYEDRDLKPNEELFFSLTLIPFTSVNSPAIK